MKPLHFAAVLALGLSACADSPPEIQITQAQQPSTTCALAATGGVGILRGSLNVGFSGSYLLGFIFNSNLTNSNLTVGAEPIGGANTDTGAVYLDRVSFSYAVQSSTGQSSVSIPAEDIAIFASVPSSSKGNQLVMNIITQKAAEKLAAATAGGEDLTVLVTLQLKGKTATGSGAESNEITYPIHVFSAPVDIPACGTAVIPAPAGPCGNAGQDGAYPTCR
jgi:hypothetical protein